MRYLPALIIVVILAVAMSACTCANAATLTLADVGAYDSLVGSPTTLDKSGAKTEEEWVEGILGVDVTYTQLDDISGGDNWIAVSDGVAGDYAFDLTPYNPAYFLVKVGGGEGTGTDQTHYLFDNAESMSWAFVNLSVFGEGVALDNIGIVSHVGVSAVPLPPAVWLFGAGLLGLVGVARRKA